LGQRDANFSTEPGFGLGDAEKSFPGETASVHGCLPVLLLALDRIAIYLQTPRHVYFGWTKDYLSFWVGWFPFALDPVSQALEAKAQSAGFNPQNPFPQTP
jgi:hypothetical protein